MRFEALKVGELARRTGLTVRTLHHYDEIGLLRPSLHTESGHRLYTAADVGRLQQVVSLRQLGRPRVPDLIYIFAFRSEAGWEPFVVIERAALREEHELHRVGSVSGENVVFRFVSSGAFLTCSGRDFRAYQGDWSRWPVLPIAFRSSS